MATTDSKLTTRDVLLTAATLLTDDDNNDEYDRALTEMVVYLVGLEPDDKGVVLTLLRALR